MPVRRVWHALEAAPGAGLGGGGDDRPPRKLYTLEVDYEAQPGASDAQATLACILSRYLEPTPRPAPNLYLLWLYLLGPRARRRPRWTVHVLLAGGDAARDAAELAAARRHLGPRDRRRHGAVLARGGGTRRDGTLYRRRAPLALLAAAGGRRAEPAPRHRAVRRPRPGRTAPAHRRSRCRPPADFRLLRHSGPRSGARRPHRRGARAGDDRPRRRPAATDAP